MRSSVWEAHSTWVSVGDRCEDTFGTGVSFYIYLHHGIHIDDLNLWPITRCGDKLSPLKPLSLEARNLVAYWLEIRAFSLGFMYNCLGQILSLFQWRAYTIELMYREPQRLSNNRIQKSRFRIDITRMVPLSRISEREEVFGCHLPIEIPKLGFVLEAPYLILYLSLSLGWIAFSLLLAGLSLVSTYHTCLWETTDPSL